MTRPPRQSVLEKLRYRTWYEPDSFVLISEVIESSICRSEDAIRPGCDDRKARRLDLTEALGQLLRSVVPGDDHGRPSSHDLPSSIVRSIKFALSCPMPVVSS